MLLLETLRLHRKDLFDFHYIYFYPTKDQLRAELVQLGGHTWNIKASSSLGVLASFFQTRALIRRLNPDLIHAHMPVTGFLARCIGKVCGIPVIYTEHFDLRKYGRLTTWLNKLNYSWNHVVIAVSDATAQAIRHEFPQIQNLVTIPNGVNTSLYCRTAPDTVPHTRLAQSQRTVVGSVAVFRRQKRLDLWVDIAVALLNLDPKFLFVLIGDGPEMQSILARVRASGFDDAFIFTGLVADTRSYFAAIDVFLMTSELEGLPIALLEAMSMECLPVTPPVGGIPSLVEHAVSGVFIDPTDAVGSAQAILNVVSEETRFRSMRLGARKSIVKNNSMEFMVNKLEGIYTEYA